MLEHSLLYPLNTSTRSAMRLDGMWKFQIDWDGSGDEGDWEKGVPAPDLIPVPASFQDFYTDKKIREFTGDVWYENDILVPAHMQGDDVFLRFGAATHRAWVYINGELAGEHEGGFLPFLVDITGKARYGEKNKVVVKVNNELSETNIPCGRTITLSDGSIDAAYSDCRARCAESGISQRHRILRFAAVVDGGGDGRVSQRVLSSMCGMWRFATPAAFPAICCRCGAVRESQCGLQRL